MKTTGIAGGFHYVDERIHPPQSTDPASLLLYTLNMRYTWTSVAIIVIWISGSTLIVRAPLPSPEQFFLYLMGVTVVLAGIGFKSA